MGTDPGPHPGHRRGRETARRDAASDRARVAAGPLAVDPADPGHRHGRTPGGEHRRRGDHTVSRRGRVADQERRLSARYPAVERKATVEPPMKKSATL